MRKAVRLGVFLIIQSLTNGERHLKPSISMRSPISIGDRISILKIQPLHLESENEPVIRWHQSLAVWSMCEQQSGSLFSPAPPTCAPQQTGRCEHRDDTYFFLERSLSCRTRVCHQFLPFRAHRCNRAAPTRAEGTLQKGTINLPQLLFGLPLETRPRLTTFSNTHNTAGLIIGHSFLLQSSLVLNLQ